MHKNRIVIYAINRNSQTVLTGLQQFVTCKQPLKPYK